MSTAFQLVSAGIQIAWVYLLIGVIVFVTRRRPAVDLAARAPSSPVNRAEILSMVGYAIVAQSGLSGALPGYGRLPG